MSCEKFLVYILNGEGLYLHCTNDTNSHSNYHVENRNFFDNKCVYLSKEDIKYLLVVLKYAHIFISTLFHIILTVWLVLRRWILTIEYDIKKKKVIS